MAPGTPKRKPSRRTTSPHELNERRPRQSRQSRIIRLRIDVPVLTHVVASGASVSAATAGLDNRSRAEHEEPELIPNESDSDTDGASAAAAPHRLFRNVIAPSPVQEASIAPSVLARQSTEERSQAPNESTAARATAAQVVTVHRLGSEGPVQAANATLALAEEEGQRLGVRQPSVQVLVEAGEFTDGSMIEASVNDGSMNEASLDSVIDRSLTQEASIVPSVRESNESSATQAAPEYSLDREAGAVQAANATPTVAEEEDQPIGVRQPSVQASVKDGQVTNGSMIEASSNGGGSMNEASLDSVHAATIVKASTISNSAKSSPSSVTRHVDAAPTDSVSASSETAQATTSLTHKLHSVTPKAPGVIYVSAERETRSQAKSRLRESAGRRAARAVSAAQMEADARFAAALAKEDEQLMGGELTASGEDNESDYGGSARRSREVSFGSRESRKALHIGARTGLDSGDSSDEEEEHDSDFEDDAFVSNKWNADKGTGARNGKAKLKRYRAQDSVNKSNKRQRVVAEAPSPAMPPTGKGKRKLNSTHQGTAVDLPIQAQHDQPMDVRASKRHRGLERTEQVSHHRTQSVDSEQGREDVQQEEGSDDELPSYMLALTGPAPALDGSFATGLQREFLDCDEFEREFEAFMAERFTLWKRRTSTKPQTRNKSVANKEDSIPMRFRWYAATMKCTHAMEKQSKEKAVAPVAEEASQGLPNTQPMAPKTEVKDKVRPKKKRGKRRFHRFTGCTATVNAIVQRVQPPTHKDDGFRVRWSSSGGHNHQCSPEIFQYYTENRLPETEEMITDVSRFLAVGGTATGICNQIRSETGLKTKMADMHNLIAKVRRTQTPGSTLEDRLDNQFKDFKKLGGSWVDMYTDATTNTTRSVAFQSARQKRLFKASPEVVMVDCTHGTNRSRFTLFAFVVHDIFGKGQFVFSALLQRETMDNMEDAIASFVKANSDSQKVRAFVVDKDFKERTLLRKYFPQARILLCHYHVIKVFAKKVKELVRGTKEEKDYIISIMRSMVYAKTQRVYEALKLLLAKEISKTMNADDVDHHEVNDEDNLFSDVENDESDQEEDVEEDDTNYYDDDEVRQVQEGAVRDARDDDDVRRGKLHRFVRYFVTNWEPCEEEWVSYRRQNVAHLGNNTNNRIEAKWGADKRVLNAHMDLEQTVKAIRMLQELNEDEYLEELTKCGSRYSHSGDPELELLLNTVSEHAYELTKGEYDAVMTLGVDYSVVETERNAILRNANEVEGHEPIAHTIFLEDYQCSCFFFQVRLLPCRHVCFYRKYKAFEYVIPFKYIKPRWCLRHPANNILLGEVTPGYYRIRPTKPKPSDKLSQGDKFCKIMAIMKDIAGTVAQLKTGEFNAWLRAMTQVRNDCDAGLLPTILNGDGDDGESRADDGYGRAGDGDDRESRTDDGDSRAGDGDDRESRADDGESRAGGAHRGEPDRASYRQDADDEELVDSNKNMPPTKSTERTEAEGDSPNASDRVKFKIESPVRMRTARNRKKVVQQKAVFDEIMRKAKTFLGRKGIAVTSCTLDVAQRVLEQGLYSFRNVVPLVCGIPIKPMADAVLVPKRPEHVIPDSRAVRFILEEDVLDRVRNDLYEATVETGNNINTRYEGHVAVLGDGNGCVSVAHLRTMEFFHGAVKEVHTVVTTVEWLRRIPATKKKIVAPFDNISDTVSKTLIQDAVDACETIPLGDVRTYLDVANGHNVLEIASSKWLSTGSVNMLLQASTSMHPEVAAVKPEYFTMKDKESRDRILLATEPFADGKTRIVSIVNLNGRHWSAFMLDRGEGECIIYDPYDDEDREAREASLTDTVREFVDENKDSFPIPISYRPATEAFGSLFQDDGNSCGVFCAVFLEYVLNYATLSEEDILPGSVYRARYMITVAAILKTLVEGHI